MSKPQFFASGKRPMLWIIFFAITHRVVYRCARLVGMVCTFWSISSILNQLQVTGCSLLLCINFSGTQNDRCVTDTKESKTPQYQYPQPDPYCSHKPFVQEHTSDNMDNGRKLYQLCTYCHYDFDSLLTHLGIRWYIQIHFLLWLFLYLYWNFPGICSH